MLTHLHPSPVEILLITTFRCNAACDNCCFGCLPNVGRTMTIGEMKHYVDECLRAYSTIRILSLTGGECFLLGSNLDEIVKYGSSKGLYVELMTNGYWGKSYTQALERIKTLKELGLCSIGFSVGEDHQNRLSLKGCRNAAVASARAGLDVQVRVETRLGKSDILEQLTHDKAFMKLVNAKMIDMGLWEWREFNNGIKHCKNSLLRRCPGLTSTPCTKLGKGINITPYGDVVACCGIASLRLPSMVLGNIWKESVEDLFERIFADSLKVWIRKEGPRAVLQYVYDYSNIRFRRSDEGCSACFEIFDNPKILPFLKDTYDDWSQKIQFPL